MRIYNDETYIKRRALLGKWGSLGGMAILLIGLLMSFNPQYIYISFGGTYHAARFSRSPRQHERLEQALKGSDDRYVLFNYEFPTLHVLLGPHGLIVFRLKDKRGEIKYVGGRWKEERGLGRFFASFGSEGLGDPIRDAEDEVKNLERFLEKNDIPTDDIPIEGVVLFLNPDAKLEVENPAVPVLTVKQLKPFLRDPERRKRFKATERKELLPRLEEVLGLVEYEELEEEDDPES